MICPKFNIVFLLTLLLYNALILLCLYFKTNLLLNIFLMYLLHIFNNSNIYGILKELINYSDIIS